MPILRACRRRRATRMGFAPSPRRLFASPRRPTAAGKICGVPGAAFAPLLRWLALGLCIASLPAQALSPDSALAQCQIRSWGTTDGLPAGATTALAHSRDGYLWIGTQEGLVRFDGMRFTVFDTTNTPQITNGFVSALCPAAEGGIWIGTLGGGLLRWNQGTFSRWTTAEGLPSMKIRALLEDSAGTLWIGTEGRGLVSYLGGRFKTFTTRDGLAGNAVWSLAEGPGGTLWIGTDQFGLSRLEGGVFTTLTSKEGLPGNGILSLCTDPGGALWIGTAGGGLACLRKGTVLRYGVRDGLPGLTVSSLLPDGGGGLWVGTQEGGLALYRGGRFETFTSRQGLSNDMVLALAGDKEGGLWVGTMTGLTQLATSLFSTYTREQGLPGNIALCTYQDKAGNLWVGTTEGAAEITDSGLVRAITPRDGLPGPMVFAIHQDQAGSLWFGIEGHGMARYKDGKFEILNMRDGLICNNVRCLCDADGGGLWAGTPSGLSLIKDNRITNFTLHDGPRREGVSSLARGADGGLWVGTDSGTLHRFKDGAWTTYSCRKLLSSLADLSIDSIYVDRQGSLWMGTSGGLLRFKDAKMTAISTAAGLPGYWFYEVLEDGEGRLWMTCNRGLVVARKAELDDFAAGRIQRVRSQVYDTSDGMKSAECNGGGAPTGCRLRDGRLCFPTMNGVAIVKPEGVRLDAIPPATAIEGIKAEGESLALRQGLVLPPGVSRIEFQFTALKFLAPAKITFRYRLSGYDKDWVDAGAHREAFYTNLRPGSYAFSVIACSRDGTWGTDGPTLRLTVQPFFYQTKTFVLLCVLAAIALAAIINRLIVLQLRTRNAVLRERNRIARDIHDTVAQGLTGVALQLDTAESLLATRPEDAHNHLVRARGLVENSLEETRRAIRALRPRMLEQEHLPEALQRLGDSMTMGSGTEVRVEVRGRLRPLRDQVFEEDLWGIAQEAMTNALRHGKSSHVRVSLDYSARRLTLTVSDDGPGFVVPADEDTGTHGLLGMRERAEARGWPFELTSAPGQGTRVTVAVPLSSGFWSGRS